MPASTDTVQRNLDLTGAVLLALLFIWLWLSRRQPVPTEQPGSAVPGLSPLSVPGITTIGTLAPSLPAPGGTPTTTTPAAASQSPASRMGRRRHCRGRCGHRPLNGATCPPWCSKGNG